MDLLATFPTLHAVLGAERTLKALGLDLELIPVPRAVASDCGFCLLIHGRDGARPGNEGLLQAGAAALWKVLPASPPLQGKRYERLDPNP